MKTFFVNKEIRAPLAKGQSMVEMAIIAPLLIFFLLGIFEVGWALRNYLVLVNVNREITRFAVRPGYLDFSTLADIDTSYARVRDWAQSSVSEQLNMNFDDTDGSTTLIVSHVVVDTGKPCANPQADSGCSNCADFIDIAGHNPFPQDDLILHPGLPGYGYQSSAGRRPPLTNFGPLSTTTGPRDTRIDFDTLAANLAAQNNRFNCEIMKKGGYPSANNIIVTELFHDQPQLFGFPLISNPFTDPVPLYTQTTMRIVNATRSGGGVEGNITSGIDTIGPICLVYPMVVDSADISSPTPVNIAANGWLKWGGMFSDSEEYLENALLYPQMSLNDFSPAGGVHINSIVNKAEAFPQAALADEVDILVGRQIIIPTSASLDTPPVQVNGFVWAIIETNNLSTTGEVLARFDLVTPLPPACN